MVFAKPIRVVALPMVLFAVLGVLAPAVEAQDLDRRVPVEPGGRLLVDVDLGEEVRADRVSLDVRSHDADEVWAVADLSGLGASSVRFRLEHEAGLVRLYVRAGGVMSWLFGGPGVTIRVWVPRRFSLDLRSATGPIRIEDIEGDIRARTLDSTIDVKAIAGTLDIRTGTGVVSVSDVKGDVDVKATRGSVELAWVTGRVDVRTGEGTIKTRNVDGETQLRTGNGEIEIRDARGPNLAQTEAGPVYATFSGPPEGRLETRRGPVVVAFPSKVGVKLRARAKVGTVEIDQRRSGSEFVGALNGGGPELEVYSARGDIRIERR